MFKITLGIDGMACGMCEAHVNDTIREKFNVKKVTSSFKKGETVIISEEDIAPDQLRKAIEATGYKLVSASSEPYKKKSWFSR